MMTSDRTQSKPYAEVKMNVKSRESRENRKENRRIVKLMGTIIKIK